MKLYHVSSDNKLSKLTPRIPECACLAYEDTDTPRVCCSNSIDGCLSAIQEGEGRFFVYEIDGKYPIITPTPEQVRDAKHTGEVWILEEVKVNLIGEIEVEDYNRKECYLIGKKDVYVMYYPWKWISKV